jgi:hypothetical protein
MNWLNVFGLFLAGLVLFFAALRVERRALWLVLALLWAPALLAIGRWSGTGGHWGETALGIGAAALIAGGWWLVLGRRLARPSSDSIKVWGQESGAKSKAQETAALQAELKRAREEAARLEAEVRRLRGGNGHEAGQGRG